MMIFRSFQTERFSTFYLYTIPTPVYNTYTSIQYLQSMKSVNIWVKNYLHVDKFSEKFSDKNAYLYEYFCQHSCTRSLRIHIAR